MRRPQVAAHQRVADSSSSHSDQRVVSCAAANPQFDKPRNQGSVVVTVEGNVGVWEPGRQEIAHKVRRHSVWRRQSRQDGKRLDRTVRYQARLAVDDAISGGVLRVPRGKGCDYYARVD